MLEKVELLAPVGSEESLYAAVENGADAVYLGGKLFNARQYASNFSNEELKEVVQYCHIRQVKVYITVNILLDNNEINEIIDYILYLYNIDVDGIIVQDLGLSNIIRTVLPDFEVHASTQMTINNYMGAKFVEDMGFKRAVLARELSVGEIEYISNTTNIELEGFIHGALCVSYSGQCLMSSIIGGRSGNRGRCAQPCRMPYTFINDEGEVLQGYNNKYLLSPKDLNTIDNLDKIINSGIVSLKIEGRMKRPEYVATIVKNYKKALTNIISNNTKDVSQKDKKDIKQIFNRGFTKGFILGKDNRDFISYDKPNNRGIYIGKVINTDKSYIYIKLIEDLNLGDGIELRNDDVSFGLKVSEILLNDRSVTGGSKGDIVKIKRVNSKGNKDLEVYKTSDIKLLERAKLSYVEDSNKTTIPVFMNIEIKIDRSIKLHLWDNINYISIESEEKVEQARRVSLKEDKVKKQMGKLGNTPYHLQHIDIDIEDNAMVSLSVLNRLRRRAVTQLNEKRANSNNREYTTKDNIVSKFNGIIASNSELNNTDRGLISVKVDNIEQFKRLNLDKLDRVYINFHDDINNCINEVKNHNKEAYFYTGKILSNLDFKNLKTTIDSLERLDGVSVSNLGTLKFVKDNYNINIHGDIGLNIFNSYTMKFLYDYGVDSGTLSPELTLKQVSNIAKGGPMLKETYGYGYLPVMVTKYCPFSLIRKCKDSTNCGDCSYKKGFGLRDRKGMTFNIKRKNNTTIIYNSQPLLALEHINNIYDSGVNMIRLDFTMEKDEVEDIQDIFFEYANKNIRKDEVIKFIDKYRQKTGFTKGHYFRGVL
ncbi:DUF3656 domain-containing U32 family peptidase [Dethiothermospora halolimnae]|uniref:DUF3656 domain-containing U32 family peptidase n=1 Tax=Dethiothermospora halolimnae TaxID=3114390 RepID=UPI003CCBFD41